MNSTSLISLQIIKMNHFRVCRFTFARTAIGLRPHPTSNFLPSIGRLSSTSSPPTSSPSAFRLFVASYAPYLRSYFLYAVLGSLALNLVWARQDRLEYESKVNLRLYELEQEIKKIRGEENLSSPNTDNNADKILSKDYGKLDSKSTEVLDKESDRRPLAEMQVFQAAKSKETNGTKTIIYY